MTVSLGVSSGHCSSCLEVWLARSSFHSASVPFCSISEFVLDVIGRQFLPHLSKSLFMNSRCCNCCFYVKMAFFNLDDAKKKKTADIDIGLWLLLPVL